MNAFWTSEIGEITGNARDAFAKSFKQIPDNTMALAKIESFKNQEYMGFKYLQIDWEIVDGDFKGQKVQQKLKVYGGESRDKDPEKTRYRALNMLKLIYTLFNVKPSHSGPPTDQDLLAFTNKIAGIKVRETEPNAEGKQYNWVSEVHESKGFVCETGYSLVVTHKNNDGDIHDNAFARHAKNSLSTEDLADDIPF